MILFIKCVLLLLYFSILYLETQNIYFVSFCSVVVVLFLLLFLLSCLGFFWDLCLMDGGQGGAEDEPPSLLWGLDPVFSAYARLYITDILQMRESRQVPGFPCGSALGLKHEPLMKCKLKQ